MTFLCLKTHDLSWQDRTLNIEMMMAPNRSQLLYNKHKGLTSKCKQEKSLLDRQKNSFLRSHETDRRMMERRKDLYASRKNLILRRRASSDSRSGTPVSENLGRNSAPPRLERNSSKDERTFITHESERGSKSAEMASRLSKPAEMASRLSKPYMSSNAPPRMAVVSPRSQFRTEVATPVEQKSVQPLRNQPPFLSRIGREKSVRFENKPGVDQTDTNEETEQQRIETPIEERIKRFLETQAEFNKRKAPSGPLRVTPSPSSSSVTSSIAKRYKGLKVKVTDLEIAFDNFCNNTSDDSYHKLVRYASKMKANVKNARNASMIPALAAFKGAKMFRNNVHETTALTV